MKTTGAGGEVNGERRLDDLYREQFPSLVRLAYLLCGNQHEAEDAVQEAFMRCAPSIERLDHPPSYLRTAVVNECRARHRRSARQTTSDAPAGEAGMPHEAFETRQALAALSERQRAAVVLRYFVDVDDREIAQILGCRPATVRSLIHRAVQTLREELT